MLRTRRKLSGPALETLVSARKLRLLLIHQILLLALFSLVEFLAGHEKGIVIDATREKYGSAGNEENPPMFPE